LEIKQFDKYPSTFQQAANHHSNMVALAWCIRVSIKPLDALFSEEVTVALTYRWTI